MRITVVGCGYLGATHAACMAELGFDVLGVEVDSDKLQLLQKGQAPFFEPDLASLLSKHVDQGTLRFTDSAHEAGVFGDVHFICVGTPQLQGSFGADVSQVEDAVSELAPHLRPGALVVGKSTVPVGTAERLQVMLDELSPQDVDAELAWNPEFLREGYAVKDTLHPDRLVFGTRTSGAESKLRRVYAQAIDEGAPVVVTDYATAELVKVSANAFLATKISFINAVAEICEITGADVKELADALGYDDRIGRKFLNAGVGFGGGCLPKDIRAFLHRAGELGAEDALGFLREVDSINLHQRQRVVQLVKSMVGHIPEARVAVLGAAFKPHSDDVRDSPALYAAGELHLAGARVRVYDPEAMDNARKQFPTLNYCDSALEACQDADIVVHLTEWPEFRELGPKTLEDIVAGRRLLDGRNVLDPALWRGAGWEFRGMGRR
jgi:UDPglucose 6-dehydrogenase